MALYGPDGIQFDVRGNLYVDANQADEIQVLSPAGDLIARYTGYAYDKAGLPAAQRAALEVQVKGMALQLKDPSAGLPGGMPFCPSCDGACRKPPAVISQ